MTPPSAPAPAAAAPREDRRSHWVAVLAAVACGVAVATNVGKVPVAMPGLRAELGLGLVQSGWIASMINTVAVVAAAMVGMTVGRVGALRMMLLGLMLSSAASAAAVLHANAASLLVARFFEGAGFIVVAVSGPALISAATGAGQRRFALGLWSTYMPAGASLSIAAAPWLIPAAGWRGLWLVTAGLMGGAAWLVWSQRRHYGPGGLPSAGAPADPAGPPAWQALTRPLAWVLALSFGVWALQHFALIIWMPTYLVERRGLGPGPVALLTAAMLLACVPGNVLGGALMQRGVPRGPLLAVAQGITGLLGWACVSDAVPDGWRFAASVALSFAGGVIPAAVMSSSTTLAHAPRQIGALQGLFMQGSQLGQFIGTPAIAALVAASGQWRSALWVTGTAAALGVVLGLAAHRLESRRP